LSERRRGPISLGDVLRAEARLRPHDEATREAIERLLGAERSAPAAVLAPSAGPWKPNEPVPGPPPAGLTPAPVPSPRQPAAGAPQPPPRLRGSAVTGGHVGRIAFERPAWASAQAPPFLAAAGGDASLPPPPLFAPAHSRAILAATLATFRPGTEIDVERATGVLGAGRRLRSIPYRTVPTLRRGAQVLVDRGPALDPLADDLRQLLADLELLFGRGHLEVLSFAHCPAASEGRRRGVWAKGGSRMPWPAPGRGVPVLVVSDFALAPPLDDGDCATVGEWLQFARQVRAALCHPVALVPYPPSRWPPALVRVMGFVHWSERTTARQVMRALRESRTREAQADQRSQGSRE